MNNTFKSSAHTEMRKSLQLTLVAVLAVFLSGCGEVDSTDGEVRSSVSLPTGSALKLHCPDAGIAAEPCILDDPENPYALTPITNENKFRLADGAPSAKARFYLWATAQAVNPIGENQLNVAVALHQMYGASGSELARTQALRAYRSVLDNYFFNATFFGPFTINGVDAFTPSPVRKQVGFNLHDPNAANPSDPLPNLFNTNDQSNRTLALQQFGQWGFTYDPATDEFTRNF